MTTIRALRDLSDAEAAELYHKVALQLEKTKPQRGNLSISREKKFDLLMAGDMTGAGFTDPSAAVHSLLIELALRHGFDHAKMEADFVASKLYLNTIPHWQKKWKRLRESELTSAVEHAKTTSKRRSAAPDDPNAIVIAAGQLVRTIEQCEKALTANDNAEGDSLYFARKHELVKPICAFEAPKINKVDRDQSSVIIAAVTPLKIIRDLENNAVFVRATEKDWVREPR
jgi:hypothetical protein